MVCALKSTVSALVGTLPPQHFDIRVEAVGAALTQLPVYSTRGL